MKKVLVSKRKKALQPDSVSSILEACSKAGVATIEYDGERLKAAFHGKGSAANDPAVPDVTPEPAPRQTAAEQREAIKQSVKEEALTELEAELDQLQIDDAVAYERLAVERKELVQGAESGEGEGLQPAVSGRGVDRR